ncbi:hypothetical protein [Azohydromonas sediminis]|uniref:hypothetical protein n=1 Tax=Azohydromonas sediminis TaxID=2259674 RepID=UPI000E655638|nr:hypothetical protein [Azohydromonas sediminis]
MSGRAVSALVIAAALAGCAGTPPPDWAADAKGALDRAVAAALEGHARVEAVEFERARTQVARTGRPELLARVELMRCAAHAARLDVGPCPRFDALRADATAADRAYADHLAGRLEPADAARLPEHHRRAAAGDAKALAATTDPLGRLVAAAVLLQSGRATPEVVAQAVDAASSQGWRRALLAWLHVQRRQAERAGDAAEAARIQRRIDVAGGTR